MVSIFSGYKLLLRETKKVYRKGYPRNPFLPLPLRNTSFYRNTFLPEGVPLRDTKSFSYLFGIRRKFTFFLGNEESLLRDTNFFLPIRKDTKKVYFLFGIRRKSPYTPKRYYPEKILPLYPFGVLDTTPIPLYPGGVPGTGYREKLLWVVSSTPYPEGV